MALSSLALAKHRRMQELCAGLDLELIVLASRFRGLRRYLELAGRTRGLLCTRRVDVLLVQNPSLVLAARCVVMCSIFSYRLVVDAHNVA